MPLNRSGGTPQSRFGEVKALVVARACALAAVNRAVMEAMAQITPFHNMMRFRFPIASGKFFAATIQNPSRLLL